MKDKQIYIVLDHKGVHEYDIVKESTDKGEEITLFRSNNPTWTEQSKGEKIMSLVNNGDGITFDRKFKSLDYAELFELRLLLNFEQQIDNNSLNRKKYRIVEDKTLFEA
jgi:hypothetical protein